MGCSLLIDTKELADSANSSELPGEAGRATGGAGQAPTTGGSATANAGGADVAGAGFGSAHGGVFGAGGAGATGASAGHAGVTSGGTGATAGAPSANGGADAGGASAGGAGGGVWTYWTGWFNRDNPTGLGDSEHRAQFASVCEHPIGFEARVAGSETPYYETGERLIANATFGIECRNIDQADESCLDYEIRFWCSSEWPVAGTWTNWLNRDSPAGVGDAEQLSLFPSTYVPCSTPWAVEATTLSGIDFALTGDFVRIEPGYGFNCVNAAQPDGACSDYKVRFFCPELSAD